MATRYGRGNSRVRTRGGRSAIRGQKTSGLRGRRSAQNKDSLSNRFAPLDSSEDDMFISDENDSNDGFVT